MSKMGRDRVPRPLDRLLRSGSAVGLSDGQLLERFARRHDEAAEAAFAAIIERHGPMVLSVCRRHLSCHEDANDAFQATFLILVRQAGTVRRRDSLASWLHGVAIRVSARSRAASARRSVVERRAAEKTTIAAAATAAAPPRDDLSEIWREVDRLPRLLHSAVMLCYFEGLSHEQAAARLGWPVGTVRSRLARARDRLRTRFARQGYDPASPLAGLPLLKLLAGRVPASLVEPTARAAMLVAAQDAFEAGLVSASVLSLTEGALRAMFFTKIKLTAAAVMVGLLVASAGAYAYQPLGFGEAPASPKASDTASGDSEQAAGAASSPRRESDQFNPVHPARARVLIARADPRPRWRQPTEAEQQAAVIKRITHEFAPSSIRMEMTVEQFTASNGSFGSTPDMTIEKVYIETDKGERYYDDIYIVPGRDTSRNTSFSNGKKSAGLMYKEGDTSKVISAGEEDFRNEQRYGYYEAPEPFRWSRVGMAPLQEALPTARKLGRAEVIGRPCERYLFEEVKSPTSSQSLVYTLDRATSVPLRVAAYKDVQHVQDDRPTWIWEALSLDTIKDHHFPLKSQHVEYVWSAKDADTTEQPHFKELIEVKSIEYDASYPASMFWPAAEIAAYDTAIKAAIKKSMTTAPAPVTPIADPIRVDPNSESWPMWPGLVLSGVLLVVALIIRMRTR